MARCICFFAVCLMVINLARAEIDVTVDPVRGNVSLQQAIDQVKRLRALPGRAKEPAVITLHAGTYFLDRPVAITGNDADLLITAPAGQKVVLSGGMQLGDWKPAELHGQPCLECDLPAVRMGLWNFNQLWVNDQRAARARYPIHGVLRVAVSKVDKTKPWNQGQPFFQVHPGDLPETLPTNAEAVICNRWEESRLQKLTFNPAENRVDSGWKTVFQLEDGDVYWLEGSKDWLKEPGQWALDRRAGKVYYIPRPGESAAKMVAVAPVQQKLLQLDHCKNVVFKGIAFEHNEWDLPDRTGDGSAPLGGFGQAAFGVPGAVQLDYCIDCQFDRCNFSHLGSYGLFLETGCHGNQITHCSFTDLGAGGIKIGNADLRNGDENQTANNSISDCRISHCGQVFFSGIGIWIGQSYGNRIEHNEISDQPYTAISMGWTWGYGPAHCHDNRVEKNLVHHIGRMSDGEPPLLSDMGGVYTLGRQPGTVISGNIFHDIAGRVYGGWGIYLDEGSSEILVENNLVYRTTHGGFHQNTGQNNTVRNNIFALGRDVQIARTLEEPHKSLSFSRNFVYWDSGVFTGTGPSGWELDHNFYDCQGNGKLEFGGRSLQQWRQAGEDLHTVIGKADFANPAQNDWTPSESAMKQIGFEPLKLDGVGPRD